MKKLYLFFVFVLALVANVNAKITPENYSNLHVDNVWFEGVKIRYYCNYAHFTITNTGDKKIEGTLWTNERYTFEGDDQINYWVSSSLNVSLEPNQTETYVCPFRTVQHADSDNITFCITAEQTDDEIFSCQYSARPRGRVNANIEMDISGVPVVCNVSDGSYNPYEHVVMITTQTPAVNWTYNNLEDEPVLDQLRIRFRHMRSIEDGMDYSTTIYSQPMFESIGAHESLNGSVTPDEPLVDGEYYMITYEYVFENMFHTLLRINYAADPVVFKVELPTGIKEVEAIDEDKPIYTLGGVRITNTDNLPKGIYVRDGKKFVVK